MHVSIDIHDDFLLDRWQATHKRQTMPGGIEMYLTQFKSRHQSTESRAFLWIFSLDIHLKQAITTISSPFSLIYAQLDRYRDKIIQKSIDQCAQWIQFLRILSPITISHQYPLYDDPTDIHSEYPVDLQTEFQLVIIYANPVNKPPVISMTTTTTRTSYETFANGLASILPWIQINPTKESLHETASQACEWPQVRVLWIWKSTLPMPPHQHPPMQHPPHPPDQDNNNIALKLEWPMTSAL